MGTVLLRNFFLGLEKHSAEPTSCLEARILIRGGSLKFFSIVGLLPRPLWLPVIRWPKNLLFIHLRNPVHLRWQQQADMVCMRAFIPT
jgi:hypothetical protein